MNEKQCLLFLVGKDEVRLSRLQETLLKLGTETCIVESLDAIASDRVELTPCFLFCHDFPVVSQYQRAQFRKLCQRKLIVMMLDEPEPRQVAWYFRLGAVDVQTLDAPEEDFVATLERIRDESERRQRTERYRQELEKTNHDLQESLQSLKQDQIAGLEVQKSLMPESPLRFGDFEISHSVEPSLYLSGDFVGYNFVLDRYLLFYFVDVSGHGASSAFVTVLLRFMIGRVIRRHILGNDWEALARAPEGLVEHINSQILATGLGKHLTIFAGSLDTQTNNLRYVVGAQLPQPILISDGAASYLPGKGKAAGIFEEVEWDVEEVMLPAKSALVLLSDGVLDVLQEKSLAQKEQSLLASLSTEIRHIDQVKEALSLQFTEGPQDDISVLLLTRGLV